MKVVFYSTSAEDHFRYRLPVARRLQDAGYRLVFAGPGGEHAARIEQEGFAYRRLARSLERLSLLSDVAAGLRLGTIYRQVQPDIVHHFTLHGLVRGAIAARIGGVSWMVQSIPPITDHAKSTRLLRAGGRTVLRRALRNAEVTFRTHLDRQTLLSINCVRPEQTHIIASAGIDLEQHPYREEPDRTPVAALIGRLQDRGAVEAFVEAARTLHARGLEARFVLIATHGDAAAVPRPQLDVWQEEGFVEWWGRRHDEVHALESIHVACMLEENHGEVPDILLEAAAAGRPLVTLDDPSLRQLVRHGITGQIVASREAQAIGAALEPLLRDGDLRKRLGRNARHLVETECSADRVAQQTMAVYERLFLKGRVI